MKDIAGQRFGRLVAVVRVTPTGRLWTCQCDCGQTAHVDTKSLNSGNTRSCGCLKREMYARGVNVTHRMSHTPEYHPWKSMKWRCQNPKAQCYPDYGGRGIYVEPRWSDSIAEFVKDVGPRPSPRHTIDRIDNAGSYVPGNVRWATPKQQAANRNNKKPSLPRVMKSCDRCGVEFPVPPWRKQSARYCSPVCRDRRFHAP